MQEDNKFIHYKNLTELLLNVVKLRLAMYLGYATISNLSTFIIGYRFGKTSGNDEYFGENGFLEWFDKTQYPLNRSSWTATFIEAADGDEKLALNLYFKYLEAYYNYTHKNLL